MFGLTKDQFLSFVRHLVTFIGGILIAKGNIDPAAIETIGGVVVTIAGLIFSFADKTDKKPPTPPAA